MPEQTPSRWRAVSQTWPALRVVEGVWRWGASHLRGCCAWNVVSGSLLRASCVAAVASLMILSAGAASAQNANPMSVTAEVLPDNPCDSKTSAPSTTPLVTTCSASGAGYTATATAAARAGRNGFVSATTSLAGTLSEPIGIINANAMYYQYITIGGAPIGDISRVMLSAAATLAVTGGMPAAAAELQAGVVYDPAAPVAQTGDFAISPGSYTLVANINGSDFIGGANTFFYSLFVRGGIFATVDASDLSSSAVASAPSISIFGVVNGQEVDITERYTLTFDPDDPESPVTATPEPASLALLATGFAGLGGAAWRRRRSVATQP